MGILNLTPDSFSDGGIYNVPEKAVEHAFRLLDEGASWLDIGAESSRPGSDAVSEGEELDRLMPVVEEILKQKPDTVISVDTYKSGVASAALKSGCAIINDISAGDFDKKMIPTVAARPLRTSAKARSTRPASGISASGSLAVSGVIRQR